MKIIFRILLFVHLGLMLFGLYNILFMAEYIHASKYVFIGFIGTILYLTALLLFPIKIKFQSFLLFICVFLYFLSLIGLVFPVILKNYWGVLFGLVLFLLLMSLFVYSGKTLFETKKDYLFLIGSSLVSFPFLFEIKHNVAVFATGIILLLLTGTIVLRLYRYQSK